MTFLLEEYRQLLSLGKEYFVVMFAVCFIPVAPTLEHGTSAKRFVSIQFLNLRHSVGLLRRAISPSQSRCLIQTQNKHRYPCLEWGSNSGLQLSSERR
jgi:hypothetical protein